MPLVHINKLMQLIVDPPPQKVCAELMTYINVLSYASLPLYLSVSLPSLFPLSSPSLPPLFPLSSLSLPSLLLFSFSCFLLCDDFTFFLRQEIVPKWWQDHRPRPQCRPEYVEYSGGGTPRRSATARSVSAAD